MTRKELENRGKEILFKLEQGIAKITTSDLTEEQELEIEPALQELLRLHAKITKRLDKDES